MLLLVMPEILIEWDKHNDCGSYQRKKHVSGNFLAVAQHDIAQESPKECDTYGLTVRYFSACHANFLFFVDKRK